jgi:2-haloacid dehalogenase
MPIHRRQLLVAATALFSAPTAVARAQASRQRLHAVVFDGFAIFDARRALALAESAFPGRGAELHDVWRARQLDYQRLRASGERYADFMQVTSDSLEFAVRALRLELSAAARAALLDVYFALDAWPEAKLALRSLREEGLRLALLSNMTPRMLDSAIENAGLRGLFDLVMSTNEVRSFKPARRAYALGPRALGLSRDAILFVASAGWDVAGAKWFGYPTYWVNRTEAPAEVLDAAPDGVGHDLTDLVAFVNERLDELSSGDAP